LKVYLDSSAIVKLYARRRTLLQRVSKSCCAEGTNSDRNARIQRRESQIISLAVTLLWVIRNTGRGMNRNSPATARDSGGSGSPRISVNPIQPSTENKSLGSRNEIDFGAESSPSTFSLATLLFRRSPAGRQDSLPACLLRLQPDWIFTSWTLSKGFIRSLEFPFPKLCWRDILHEWFAYR